MTAESSPQQTDINNRNITQVIYGLYAASLIFGVTGIIAIVLNYIKRDDVVNTVYESHFRWQIRTFWASVAYVLLGYLTLLALGFGLLVWAAVFIWFVYRIAKGWLRLTEGKPMYAA